MRVQEALGKERVLDRVMAFRELHQLPRNVAIQRTKSAVIQRHSRNNDATEQRQRKHTYGDCVDSEVKEHIQTIGRSVLEGNAHTKKALTSASAMRGPRCQLRTKPILRGPSVRCFAIARRARHASLLSGAHLTPYRPIPPDIAACTSLFPVVGTVSRYPRLVARLRLDVSRSS